jgi:hypothetical protein
MQLQWTETEGHAHATGGNTVYPETFEIEWQPAPEMYFVFGNGRQFGHKETMAAAKAVCQKIHDAIHNGTPDNLKLQ